jgi:hypothetical protein
MAKGYTTAADVATQLGRTLTPDQITYLDALVIPTVEEWIDENGGRAYGEGVVTGELLAFSSPYTWLSKAPVQSVEAVRGWFWGQSPSDIAPINGVYWRLVDARTGYFYLPAWRSYEGVEVDYTPDSEIPNKIKLAAAILAGYYMRTVIHPETEWLTDYASGQDVRLKFREMKIPESVYELLGTGGGNYVIA